MLLPKYSIVVFVLCIAKICGNPTGSPETGENVCEPGWINFKGEKCFKIFGIGTGGNNLPQDFSAAKSNCTQYNATHLATIHSLKEQSLLNVMLGLAAVKGLSDDMVWIGGENNYPPKSSLHWIDGSSHNFYNGISSGEEKRCLAMRSSPPSRLGKWEWEDCRKEAPYICQKDVTPRPTDSPSGAQSQPQPRAGVENLLPPCRSIGGAEQQGYREFNPISSSRTACYRLVEGQMSWEAAEQRCTQDGGHLVSIHNEYEESLVRVLPHLSGSSSGGSDEGQQEVWLGLHGGNFLQSNGSIQFSWTDGSRLVDLNGWREQLADMQIKLDAESYCVYQDFYGRWAVSWDEDCRAAKSFICKITA